MRNSYEMSLLKKKKSQYLIKEHINCVNSLIVPE